MCEIDENRQIEPEQPEKPENASILTRIEEDQERKDVQERGERFAPVSPVAPVVPNRHRRIPGKPCSAKQAEYIRNLGKSCVLDVPSIVRARGVDRPEQLTKDEAREIIDWCLAANDHAFEYPEEFGQCVGPDFGGRSREYRLYINSAEWKQRCADFIMRAGGKCQICRGSGNLDVHHRDYDCLGFEEFDDVMVICRRCHKRQDKLDSRERRWEAYLSAALYRDPDLDEDELRERFDANC